MAKTRSYQKRGQSVEMFVVQAPAPVVGSRTRLGTQLFREDIPQATPEELPYVLDFLGALDKRLTFEDVIEGGLERISREIRDKMEPDVREAVSEWAMRVRR